MRIYPASDILQHPQKTSKNLQHPQENLQAHFPSPPAGRRSRPLTSCKFLQRTKKIRTPPSSDCFVDCPTQFICISDFYLKSRTICDQPFVVVIFLACYKQGGQQCEPVQLWYCVSDFPVHTLVPCPLVLSSHWWNDFKKLWIPYSLKISQIPMEAMWSKLWRELL